MGDTPGKINMSPKKKFFFFLWKEIHLPWFFQGIPVKFPNCTCIDYLKNVQKSRNLVTESYDVNGSSWVALSIFNIFSYIMSKFMYSIEEIYHLLYWYVQISSKHIPSSTSNLDALTPFVIILDTSSTLRISQKSTIQSAPPFLLSSCKGHSLGSQDVCVLFQLLGKFTIWQT